MNVRFGLACLCLLISCWCCATPSVSAASNGVRPRRQSRIATLNEYLTPPALPNTHVSRGLGFPRHPRNHHGGRQHWKGPQGPGPAPSSLRHGKILTPPPTEPPGYFSRLMGWLNPFGSWQGGPSSQQQQRPDNIPQQNSNSGHQQLPKIANSYGPPAATYGVPAASYGPPAPSYGVPIIPQGGHPKGENFPHPPSPKGGQAYLPPEKSRNCNPCNQIPWIPLYHGINTEDARYAAGSTNLALPEPSESTSSQQQNKGATSIYHLPTVSHEVKIPDFSYGPPQSLSVLGANHQTSSAQLNLHHDDSKYNKNFNYAQTENRSPFAGPIPNPHLYPGAMPPLFKPKPFGSKPQDIDTSLNAPSISVEYSQKDTPISGGGIEGSNFGGINSGGSSSLDLHAPFAGPQDYQDKQSAQIDVFNPSLHHQYEQQVQNIGSSSFFGSPIDHQLSSPHHSEASLDQGYVDQLPPGAQTVPPSPVDHFPPSSFNEDHPNDNGAANSDYRHTLHSPDDHETQSAFGDQYSGAYEQKESQKVAPNPGTVQQSTSYGSQVSSDGQHVIHFEQSPIIDLSLTEVDERRKSSNDSSASSSTSTGTVEDPPVILQNPDGTYGINSTWSADDSPKIVWPQDDRSAVDVTTASTFTFSQEVSSENSQSVNFETVKDSSSHHSAASSNVPENPPALTEYTEQKLRNHSGHQEQHSEYSKSENRTKDQNSNSKQNGNFDDPRLGEEPKASGSPKKQNHDLANLYPGLIKFEDSGSYGFRLPDPPAGAMGEEPFLKALMKSYANFKKGTEQNGEQPSTLPGNRETWFDPRQINLGAGFKPSPDHLHRLQSFVDAKLKSANRQQGAKRNKQVQIIIPYTSQYTPKPFHPASVDWSARTSPAQTQARKVPIYDTNRDYLAQETQRIDDKDSQILLPLKNSSRSKDITRSSDPAKTNTSIDVLRLQKNIDNWTIQEYSRGTTASTEVPTFSRPYLLPSKKIPNEYFTTTEPVVSSENTTGETKKEIADVLAGFSFNDLDHEASASDQIHISHVQVSSHINEVSSVFPKLEETTTSTSVITSSTIEKNSWKELPVSISPLNKERVYVVTPQSVLTLPTTRRSKSYDKLEINESAKNSMKKQNLDKFESIERAYQVLPQAVNSLVVASTGPATIPLWGIMEHEKYVASSNDSTPESPVLYAGHSKVSHVRQ